MYLTLLWPGLDAAACGATELHWDLLTPGLGGELLNTLLRHRANLSEKGSIFLCLEGENIWIGLSFLSLPNRSLIL